MVLRYVRHTVSSPHSAVPKQIPPRIYQQPRWTIFLCVGSIRSTAVSMYHTLSCFTCITIVMSLLLVVAHQEDPCTRCLWGSTVVRHRHNQDSLPRLGGLLGILVPMFDTSNVYVTPKDLRRLIREPEYFRAVIIIWRGPR